MTSHSIDLNTQGFLDTECPQRPGYLVYSTLSRKQNLQRTPQDKLDSYEGDLKDPDRNHSSTETNG